MTDKRLALAARLLPHMEREMQANAYKGDVWGEADAEALALEVIYHAAKLDRAVRAGDTAAVRELCADVANTAAMVGDKLGVLGEVPPLPEGHEVGAGGTGSKALRNYCAMHQHLLAINEFPRAEGEGADSGGLA